MLVFGKFCVRTKLMIPILDDYGSLGNPLIPLIMQHGELRNREFKQSCFVLILENFLRKSSFSLLEK